MVRRPPSSPPSIPGFESIRLLGSGGFADVFLYQQTHPRRQVAVKVLLKERMAASTIAGFTEEANLMAQFANHPSIVAVYQAGVSDDGRPYLVMEYCAKPNLQVRHRAERFGEADTLRIGVQIAAALETTHRAGILHRDIKPANILVTEYGRPKLTDFGISAVGGQELVGMSVPWSPPESLTVPATGTAASDVYSLAATLYTLLTNLTPFFVVGGSNSGLDMIARIQASPVPPIGRHDVSEAFEAVLRRAMAKQPEDRYSSALEFARALQRVQIGHGMQPTAIEVAEEELTTPVHDESEEDDGTDETRLRTEVPTIPPISALGAASPPAETPLPATEPAAAPMHSASPPPAVPTPSTPRRRLLLPVGLGIAALVAIGVTTAVLLSGMGGQSAAPAMKTAEAVADRGASSPSPATSPPGGSAAAIGEEAAMQLLIPAESCARVNGVGWEQTDPIPLRDGVGEAFDANGVGAGILGTRLVGNVDVNGDGVDEAVLVLKCTGTPQSQCCSGPGSVIHKVVALDVSGQAPKRVGDSIFAPAASVSRGNGALGIDDGEHKVVIDGHDIVAYETPTDPASLDPSEAAALSGWFRYTWVGDQWQRSSR